MQRFLTRIEPYQHNQIIIFKVIHIECILINKAMYFNFQNMAALCDNNAGKSKFWFSRSPCGDARYLVIPCNSFPHQLIFTSTDWPTLVRSPFLLLLLTLLQPHGYLAEDWPLAKTNLDAILYASLRNVHLLARTKPGRCIHFTRQDHSFERTL